MDNTSDTNHELPPYYVYLLTDPRESHSIFYVGKGKGDRAYAHETEAADENKDTKKIEKIKQIKEGGMTHGIVVVGRYETEAEAFAVEATLIKWVYGFNILTNAIQGHRHESIRPKDNYENLAGIDIPRLLRGLGDGTYTREQKETIIHNRIYEKLTWLQEELKVNLQEYSVSDPDITKPQDPCVWVEGFHENIKAQVKLQLTGEKVIINFRPTSSSRHARDEFTKNVEAYGFESKNKGHYAPLPNLNNGIRIDCIETIQSVLLSAIKQLLGLPHH